MNALHPLSTFCFSVLFFSFLSLSLSLYISIYLSLSISHTLSLSLNNSYPTSTLQLTQTDGQTDRQTAGSLFKRSEEQNGYRQMLISLTLVDTPASTEISQTLLTITPHSLSLSPFLALHILSPYFLLSLLSLSIPFSLSLSPVPPFKMLQKYLSTDFSVHSGWGVCAFGVPFDTM